MNLDLKDLLLATADIKLSVNGDEISVSDVPLLGCSNMEELAQAAYQQYFDKEPNEGEIENYEVEDYCNIPDDLVDCDMNIDEDVFTVIEDLDYLDDDDIERIWEYATEIENKDLSNIIKEGIVEINNQSKDNYQGKYNDMEDVAYQECQEGLFTIERLLELNVIDLEKLGGLLEEDYQITESGYLFRR